MSQGCGERNAAIPGRAQDPVWIGVVVLRVEVRLLLVGRGLEVLEVLQHRAHGVHKHLLDLLLHVAGEVLEADGLHVLGAEAAHLHLLQVLHIHVFLQLVEGLWRREAVPPPRECECESHQGLRQIAKAVHPLVHVVSRQVIVVLVQLVPDEDGPFKVGIDLAALLERGHCGSIPGLFDAQHDVTLVFHEPHHQLLDAVR
mmetsp:Transcript_48693/g.112848  ORF Transcript_48693/g.112848 Transcript_48693/m.112848 type:complete len:200 (+) Transcript_48693:1207-1806(+)